MIHIHFKHMYVCVRLSGGIKMFDCHFGGFSFYGSSVVKKLGLTRVKTIDNSLIFKIIIFE